MTAAFDTVVVGAGLAGACAALYLSLHERVLVLDADGPASGASGAAAGLLNPLMGRRARPSWRSEEAMAALEETLARAGAGPLFTPGGVLRPVHAPEQARAFREAARFLPDEASWLDPPEVDERFPDVRAPEGALLVHRAGALSVPALVRALLGAAVRRGAIVRTWRVTGWGEEQDGAYVLTAPEAAGEAPARLPARRVLLAMGYGFHAHPALAGLRLHAVKGQTIRVERPAGLALGLPVAGAGYVVPEPAPEGAPETVLIGSSYERGFTDLHPSPEQSHLLLDRAVRMVPALAAAPLVEARAGVRVTVPGTRLPLLGPLPGLERVWLFTGLGSKGLLLAPLLARDLPRFFDHPEAIPTELKI